MSRVRPAPYRKVKKVLESYGFKAVRQRGSEVMFRHSDGRTTQAPNHPSEEIGPGLLRKIMKDIGADRDDFLKRL